MLLQKRMDISWMNESIETGAWHPSHRLFSICLRLASCRYASDLSRRVIGKRNGVFATFLGAATGIHDYTQRRQ
jgi:hypothetical protein